MNKWLLSTCKQMIQFWVTSVYKEYIYLLIEWENE